VSATPAAKSNAVASATFGLMRLEDVDESLGQFGTVLMYGNNFGLFGSRSKACWLLRTLRPLADRIVAGSNDLYRTDDPVHLAYQEHNPRRGRMPGHSASASATAT
jgi:hypothetical protein